MNGLPRTHFLEITAFLSRYINEYLKISGQPAKDLQEFCFAVDLPIETVDLPIGKVYWKKLSLISI